jgi:hypothetical protein
MKLSTRICSSNVWCSSGHLRSSLLFCTKTNTYNDLWHIAIHIPAFGCNVCLDPLVSLDRFSVLNQPSETLFKVIIPLYSYSSFVFEEQ